MENLPGDLINEVLVWLPVKSLLRFRCISKSWHQIIDSRYFISCHLDKSSKNRLHSNLMILSEGSRFYTHNVFRATEDIILNYPPFEQEFEQEFVLYFYQIQNTSYDVATYVCNGLVLLNPLECHFFVLNPSTRRLRKLPAFPVDYPLEYNKHPYFGFGYDPTNDDYKVVLLRSFTLPYEVWIFGFKSNSWRRVPDFPYVACDEIEFGDGNSFVDGCVHFLCYESQGEKSYIVAFDLAKESFSLVPLPTRGLHSCLQVLEGCLSIKLLTWDKVDFYMRKKDGVGFTWTKLFSLTTQQTSECGFGYIHNVRMFGYSKERDKILLYNNGMIFSYDLKETSTIQITPSTHGWSNLINCVESLVPVGSKTLARCTSVEEDIHSLFEENE